MQNCLTFISGKKFNLFLFCFILPQKQSNGWDFHLFLYGRIRNDRKSFNIRVCINVSVMAVKIHLNSGELLCSSCGNLVGDKDKSCKSCNSKFEGEVKESDIFKIIIATESEDETQNAVKIFRMLSGTSVFDSQYIENLIKDLQNSEFPERIVYALVILKFYAKKYDEVNKRIYELIKKMRKEKKDEILNGLNELENLESSRKGILEKIRGLEVEYSELLDKYFEFIKKKEILLKGRIEEFQKEVGRRKMQAKMLVEKEKSLLEREHKLREKERVLDGEITTIKDSTEKLKEGSLTKEEWMAAQKEIQDKLYKIREEVVNKGKRDNKDGLIKEVLGILDKLLEKLPDEVIEEFAVSKDFELYKKVMEMYGLGGAGGTSR